MERTSSRLLTALRGRGRELAVLCAGLAAGAALLWAGATVQDGLRTASDVAVARLSSTVADTVVAEWLRMLRASELPVAPAGETFVSWDKSDQEPLEPESPDPSAVVSPGSRAGPDAHSSVFWTLLAEAERRELVEHDDAGALELVLEALDKNPDERDRPAGWLRALQLAARLGEPDVVRKQWAHLRDTPISLAPASDEEIPYRVLGWLALPPEIRSKVPPVSVLGPDELERFDLADDRVVLGPPEDPSARFELAPMVEVLCERMGRELPPLDRRKTRALLAQVAMPAIEDDGRWHALGLEGRPFMVRRSLLVQTGCFYSPSQLQRTLVERSSLPAGFALDFEGTNETLGVALRPRVPLPDSPFAFTLRHGDPASLGEAEASRLRILRGALLTLALVCVAGGFLMARVLARQRKLAELKSAFIAGVSHDLRTPLASILLLAENLETGVAGEADRARYHVALRKEATRLRRLVDDVLDFARLERGEAPRLEREEVELARFVDELAEELGARVAEAGRAFSCERGVLPASAALDAQAVRRALDNLVDNALKHGQGALRLSAASAGGRLRLAVADEGPGVPAAHRERVFEPFERLNGANGHAGGTGLGLAIVRSIARAHGGEARVRADERGVGAVFELDMPLEEPPA